MVEYSLRLDTLFYSLSDPTRRDILQHIAGRELTISELVEKYRMSFAAISKHIKVLETAQLISRRKEGRKCFVKLKPDALAEADRYLEQYRQMWQGRFSKLDTLLEERK